MNLSDWAIRNPVPTLILFSALSIAGIWGLFRLQIQDNPSVELPFVTVDAPLEGAAPEQLEDSVAKKLEDRLKALSDVDRIITTIRPGLVSLTVYFDISKDAEKALSQTRDAVDATRSELPSELKPPLVKLRDTTGQPVLTYILDARNMSEADRTSLIDTTLAPMFMGVKDVARVTRIGGLRREIRVKLNAATIDSLGITASEVSNALTNMTADQSGGDVFIGDTHRTVRTLGAINDVSRLREIAIPVTTTNATLGDDSELQTASHVRLGQLGSVTNGLEDRAAWAGLNGKTVVGLQVTVLQGGSEIDVAAGIRRLASQYNARHSGTSLLEIDNTADAVYENYKGSLHLLYEGAILTIFVVGLFLRRTSATLISAIALPLSILPTFAVMEIAGFTLNSLTLLALSLVIGVLVDDAIVEVENIVRHERSGKSSMDAASEASKEIGIAVVATTLAVVAVFLPTGLMGGLNGRYFRQFGLTAATAVLASLLVARMLVPMLAARLMRGSDDPQIRAQLWFRYQQVVTLAITYRSWTILGAVAFSALAFSLFRFIPTGFMATDEPAAIGIVLKLPPGTSIDKTIDRAQRASQLIRGIENVADVATVVGTTESDDGEGHSEFATLNVKLTANAVKNHLEKKIKNDVEVALTRLPGAKVTVGAETTSSVDLTLKGSDSRLLEQAARNLMKELRARGDLGEIGSSVEAISPQVVVTPDLERMAEQGVTTNALATAIRIATHGDFLNGLPKLNLPQRQIPIRVEVDLPLASSMDELGQLRVTSRAGTVPISSIAHIQTSDGQSSIQRINGSRYIAIAVKSNGRPIGEVMNEIQNMQSYKALPVGVTHAFSGIAAQQEDLVLTFGWSILIGIGCIFAILVVLFKDFVTPIVVIAALPLAAGGALLSLAVDHLSLDMSAFIGLLMLAGIVSKNAILMIDYAEANRREHGASSHQAIVQACMCRARPIVMTSLAMCAGMLPTALGTGPDSAFRSAMAITVIGGLISSTVLSLIVVPALYTWVFDMRSFCRASLVGLYRGRESSAAIRFFRGLH